MNEENECFTIGSEGWESRLHAATAELGDGFWRDFAPVGRTDIDLVESTIKRTLPADFRTFLMTIGAGNFPEEFGGGIFTPLEIIEGCAGPILMLLGSAHWAREDEPRAFYISRGAINPDPARFLQGATTYRGMDPLDMVQVGYDGRSCYYQLVCGSKDGEIAFCRLTPEQTIEDTCGSFSEGLQTILSGFRREIDL